MQVEKHHRIRVQQSSVNRNQTTEMKQKLLGTKEGEFIIQHIEMYNLLLGKKAQVLEQYFTSNLFFYTTRKFMKILLS